MLVFLFVDIKGLYNIIEDTYRASSRSILR